MLAYSVAQASIMACGDPNRPPSGRPPPEGGRKRQWRPPRSFEASWAARLRRLVRLIQAYLNQVAADTAADEPDPSVDEPAVDP